MDEQAGEHSLSQKLSCPVFGADARTSGKTSLVCALFRMLDLSSGSIIIDGIDIVTTPRHLIRERLISVPQTAFFIPGTVRFNLDPARSRSDERIVASLQQSHIWDLVSEKGGLDVELQQENFSSGQLQLISLARALLRSSAVLILDEAYRG